MCSRLYDLSLVDDSYDVGIVDRREPVSNDNGRSPPSSFVESFLYNLLTLRVQGRGGFIKKEDFWVADESSCDGNSLLLSATQLGTLATNICGISLYNNTHKLTSILACLVLFHTTAMIYQYWESI